jgi:hypothetical protein
MGVVADDFWAVKVSVTKATRSKLPMSHVKGSERMPQTKYRTSRSRKRWLRATVFAWTEQPVEIQEAKVTNHEASLVARRHR